MADEPGDRIVRVACIQMEPTIAAVDDNVASFY